MLTGALCLGLLAAPGASSPERQLTELAGRYGIIIEPLRRARKVHRGDYVVSAEPVSAKALAAYVPIFAREWARYPRSAVAKTGLVRIVIGSRVRVEGAPRAAVPEFGPGWFWLDADFALSHPNYARHALHHDFFHMIDEVDSPDGRRDEAWATLNPPGVTYGKGGWLMQTSGVGTLREDLPGFLTAYATSAVEEDKAEIFAHLITSPEFVARRAAADPVLAAKITRLKTRLRIFDPAFTPEWFAPVRENASLASGA